VPEASVVTATGYITQTLPTQLGVDVPTQSKLRRHCTHAPPCEQRGVLAGQSMLTMHTTQAFVCRSQMLADAGQSDERWHCTQSPDGTSQNGAFAGHCPLPVHAAWHAWSDSQQDGVVPCPQSPSIVHCTQLP
jgi:hypothetical protein